MPLPQSQPYDSLATVTALVRSILGDFIQGIVPNVSGTVNANGTSVTWISGNQFTALLNGIAIVIGANSYTVAMVTSPTTLLLVQNAGVQNPVNYSAVIPTGDIFADAQAYVLPTINLAWRKLQKKLADKGHPRLEREIDIFSLPVAGSLDPITQQWISWTQFFDGKNLTITPTLPPDFIAPLRLWERQSTGVGVANFARLRPMHPAPDALCSRQKGSYNRYWDWRDDALYFPGSILSLDLRVRYGAYLPDIVSAGNFASTSIPIMRAGDALAYYAAAIFVEPRGAAAAAPSFVAKGDEAIGQITNSFAKLQQRASYSRIPWGSRGRRRAWRLM